MIGRIYLIENQVNHKQYIGKTYKTIEERWAEHCNDYKRERNEKRPLYSAMNKYGVKNFTITLVEETDNLEEREKYWIAYYDTYHNGYNATLGGDGKTYFDHTDEEVITKFYELKSIAKVAEYFSCHENTISIRLVNNNINTCQFQSESHIIPRIVEQYSKQGEYLQSFNDLQEAAKWIIDNKYSTAKHIPVASHIGKAARGTEGRKSAYGFVWKIIETE